MNTFSPDQIGTGGHTVGDNYKPTNTEVLMIRDAKQKEADLEREDHVSDSAADADALASAGHGTDEDYGPTTELL